MNDNQLVGIEGPSSLGEFCNGNILHIDSCRKHARQISPEALHLIASGQGVGKDVLQWCKHFLYGLNTKYLLESGLIGEKGNRSQDTDIEAVMRGLICGGSGKIAREARGIICSDTDSQNRSDVFSFMLLQALVDRVESGEHEAVLARLATSKARKNTK